MASKLLIALAVFTCVLQATAYRYSCIHYCESDSSKELQTYCCRMAKVYSSDENEDSDTTSTTSQSDAVEETVIERHCPEMRLFCPRSGSFARPFLCTSDADCAATDKCCDDVCMTRKICKTSVKRRRRSLSSSSEDPASSSGEDPTSSDDPGSSKTVDVTVDQNGKPVTVVVDGNGNPVTVAEGEAVTIIGQGPVTIVKAENATLVVPTTTAASSTAPKVKRSLPKDVAEVNITLSETATVSVLRDENGVIIADKNNNPVILIEDGGPTTVLNAEDLKVVAGHGIKNETKDSTKLEAVVSQTPIPEVSATKRRRRMAEDSDQISLFITGSSNPVTLVSGHGPLNIENKDGIAFTTLLPVDPSSDSESSANTLPLNITNTRRKIIHIVINGSGNPLTLKEGGGIVDISNTVVSQNPVEDGETVNRRRRSTSLANAVVNGDNVPVTLINGSSIIIPVLDIAGKRVETVVGEQVMDIGVSSVVLVAVSGSKLVLTNDKGTILMDKNGVPLTIKAAMATDPSTDLVYHILNGEGKRVNLVHDDHLVNIFELHGDRLIINEAMSDLELPDFSPVSVHKRSTGENVLVQNGQVLTDENNNVLVAEPAKAPEIVKVSEYQIIDGNGKAVHLVTTEGKTVSVFDGENNLLPVKEGIVTVIISDSKVTVELQDDALMVKKLNWELVVDGAGNALTLVPSSTSRRRRSAEGLVCFSKDKTFTLVDHNNVPANIFDESNNPIPVVLGEELLETTSVVFAFSVNGGFALKDAQGENLKDSDGNVLALGSTSQLPSLSVLKVIKDGSDNSLVLLDAQGNLLPITDQDGNPVPVKRGDFGMKLSNVQRAIFAESEDSTGVLLDQAGKPITDAFGEALKVTTERAQGNKKPVYVVINNAGESVALGTMEGNALVILDEDEQEAVILQGDLELQVEGSIQTRMRRSLTSTSLVDEEGNVLGDVEGSPLKVEIYEGPKNCPHTHILTDGTGTSITLVDRQGSKVKVLNSTDHEILLASGEKTLQIESSVLKVVAVDTKSRKARSTDEATDILVDENDNVIFSDDGPIKISSLEDSSEQLLIITEEFVEATLSLERLTTFVQDEMKLLVQASKSSTFASVLKQISLFTSEAGKMQDQCMKKLLTILSKETRSQEREAFLLLQEVDGL